ncbi:MAG: cyclic nucleotide-binding domain-containing protein [Deltaproteobacteria bacterium]|nr:cyclic nucleotide-binding domain-containing protein [Deltaproteobacteria bacterium]MBW2635053.1 cyclic nucleotide-binding domain-containing protein [Deltaproteobacteria bacterium]MBW2676530.1 cyclic nucleotide-binding domain-containing protein [Deltaproteobacteria bacterium]
MKTSVVAKALKDSRFFKDFEESVIAEIADIGHLVTLEAGRHVFQQGDFGKHIHIIVSGHVSLERSTDLGGRAGRVVIDMLGKGRFLGCWSTLLGEPHILMSSAYCQKPTEIISIDGAELRHIMLSNTELGLRVMERLCFLLRDRIQAAYGAMEKI